jgi:hypothetical protein
MLSTGTRDVNRASMIALPTPSRVKVQREIGSGGLLARQKYNAPAALMPITTPLTLAVNQAASFTSMIGKMRATSLTPSGVGKVSRRCRD